MDVGTLIRFLKPFRSQKFVIELWLVDTLKSPMKIKLSKLLLCSAIRRFKHSRWLEIKFWWELYEKFRNHFLFLKLTATERYSMLHFDFLINNLACIFSRMYRTSPPLLPFQSILNTENFHLKLGYRERIIQFCFRY